MGTTTATATAMVPRQAPHADRALGRSARIAVVAVAFLLAALVLGVGGAAVLRFKAPELALRLWPVDPVARGMLADAALQRQGGPDLPTAIRQARSSLALQAVNPQSLRVLGLSMLDRGDERAGDAAMLASARQSRRDLGSRLWMIERAIARNDVPSALREYDLTLRANPTSRSLLFPVMTAALADPEYIAPIADLFRTAPNWLDDYFVFAVPNGTASENLSQVLAQLASFPQERRLYHSIGLIDQLVRERRYDAAASLYQRVTGRTASTTRSEANFASIGAVVPFDWRLGDADTLDASVDEGGALVVAGNPSVATPALSRMLTLVPGRYILTSRGRVASQGSATWTLGCRETSAVLASLAVSVREGAVQGVFDVPAGCPAQTLALVVAPGDTTQPVDVIVGDVRVRAASSAPER